MSNLKFIQVGDSFNAIGLNVVWVIIGLITIYAGIKNLLDIYCACTGKTPEEAVREFEGKGYGELKLGVGEAVVSVLKPLQDEVARLEKDKAYLDSIIKENAEKAQYFANKTLRKVQRKVGFPDRIR